MSKAVFITGTSTDVGKTFVTALIAKTLTDNVISCGYYKAAASGSNSIIESDAGYVKNIAGLNQSDESLLSYLYKTPVSPHLASIIEGNAVDLKKVRKDFQNIVRKYSFVTVEGSGGIVCPLRFDDKKIMLLDIVKMLSIPVLIVADAGLGTINSTVLTIEYLKLKQIPIVGVILNNYDDSVLHQDNLKMIEYLTDVKVIARVKNGDIKLENDIEQVMSWFAEVTI